jgi:hypothetical protein
MHKVLPLLFPLIIIGLIPLIVWGTMVARKRTVANFQKLAAQLGLGFDPPKSWTVLPRIDGELRGKAVAIFTYVTGSGKSQQTWAALTVRPTNPGTFTFVLQKQGFDTKVLEFFGTHEIAVGDAAFDAAWFIRTNRPEFFGAALIPELREKLMAAQREYPRGKFELKDGVVKYYEPGNFSTAIQAARFAAAADVVGDLADVADVAGAENRT